MVIIRNLPQRVCTEYKIIYVPSGGNASEECTQQAERLYEQHIKWKIHDTLSRLGSLENTFTQVYVYDLEEIHHYDHHNTFWDRAGPQQNNNSHCLKQFYDSLNDEYQKFYSGTRRSLGS